MGNIKQIAKFRDTRSEGDPTLQRWMDHIADTLNPVLRASPIPIDFRWQEIAGVNSVSPTFALQTAQPGGAWVTVATFDARGLLTTPNPMAEYNSVNGQSIPNGAVTVINYEVKVTDTDNAVTTGTAWKFTCPADKGGDYFISANVAFNLTPNGSLALLLFKNGSRYHDLQNGALAATAYAAGAGVCGATVVTLVPGDFVDVRCFQTNGGGNPLQTNAFQNRVTIRRLV